MKNAKVKTTPATKIVLNKQKPKATKVKFSVMYGGKVVGF